MLCAVVTLQIKCSTLLLLLLGSWWTAQAHAATNWAAAKCMVVPRGTLVLPTTDDKTFDTPENAAWDSLTMCTSHACVDYNVHLSCMAIPTPSVLQCCMQQCAPQC
jgi:hypothetical protein